jgi:hypothetical protein
VPAAMICPSCRQEAPTIVRGVRAYCTACGAPRSLLEDTPVNVAGQPSKLGGGVASVVGWVILLGGGLLALTLALVLHAIFASALVTWGIGGFFGGMSLLFGLLFILGGRMLRKTGQERERGAHERAVFALAKRNAGSITPAELARVLSVPEAEADAILTQMAKQPEGHVTLEVDDDGTLRYYVNDGAGRRIGGARIRATTGARIGGAGAAGREDELAEAELLAEDEASTKRESRR